MPRTSNARKAAPEQSASKVAEAPRLVDPLAVYDACERSGEMTRDAFFRWVSQCDAVNREFADFVERRLTADFDTTRQLLAARTATEASAIWTGFVHQTVRDYTEEAGTLGKVTVEMLRDQLQVTRAEVETLTAPGRSPEIE